MFYEALIWAVIIITAYVVAWATVGTLRPGQRAFSARNLFIFVLPSALIGIALGGLMGKFGRITGLFGMGLGFGVMYVLVFGHVIRNWIRNLPERVRNGFRIAFRWIRIVAVAIAIGALVVLILYLVG